MGKTWVRCGNNRAQNSRVELPSRQKRNFHVWTRETHSTSQPADPVKSEGLQSSTRESDRHRPAEAPGPDQSRLQNHSSAEDQAAKRRRLIAKGRYVQDLGSQSQQTETKNGGQAISQPSLAEQAQKEKQEKLQRETEALRRRIAEEEAKMLAAKAAAKRREEEKAAAERARQEERENRKRRLDAGFAEAFKLTRELNASGNAPKVSAASTAEVERVLAAKTDLDVMQVKAGASSAAIKKRYRTMTLALHPDKCKAEKATDAFQKMVHAYQSLLKLSR